MLNPAPIPQPSKPNMSPCSPILPNFLTHNLQSNHHQLTMAAPKPSSPCQTRHHHLSFIPEPKPYPAITSSPPYSPTSIHPSQQHKPVPDINLQIKPFKLPKVTIAHCQEPDAPVPSPHRVSPVHPLPLPQAVAANYRRCIEIKRAHHGLEAKRKKK
jgi:hypothetical protein